MARHPQTTRAQVIAMAALLILGSCGPSAAPSGASAAVPTQRGQAGTLTVALPTLESELYIPRVAAGREKPALLAIGETLTRLDPKTRAIQPSLASSWELAKKGDKWVWSFKLRDGIEFNEGQGPVTADDVQFTFSECLKPDTTNSTCPVMSSAIDKNISNFAILGPKEFELRSARAVPELPYFVSDGAGSPVPVLPKAYYQKLGDKGYAEHPIGAGPFVFKSQIAHQELVLEAVPQHFRQTPKVKTLRFLIVPENATAVAMLNGGQADIAQVNISLLNDLKTGEVKTTRVEAVANASVWLGGQYYDLPDKNCTTCPWVGTSANALKVREALTIAIDRKTILEKLLRGEGQLAAVPFSWVPGPFEFNDPAWMPPAYDAARAKRLLAEAGYPNGFPIKLAIFPPTSVPELPDVAELVAAAWTAIGIQVDRQKMEFTPTFRAKMADRTTAGYAWVNSMVVPQDPLADMERLFSKAGSLSYLDDPVIDQTLAEARQITDQRQRAAFARKLGTDLMKRWIGIPLFSVNNVVGISKRVDLTRFLTGERGLGNFEYVTLQRP